MAADRLIWTFVDDLALRVLLIVLLLLGLPAIVVIALDRRYLIEEKTLSLTLLPAVDVADGQAVRLVQGAAGSETTYGDPLEAALAWQRDGAEWIHLVDLDAAFGRGSNAAPAGRGGAPARREGGALRRHPRRRVAARRAGHRGGAGEHRHGRAGGPAAGATGSCGEYGDRVAIGLDVRGRTLSARGWTRDGGDLYEVLDRLDKAGRGAVRGHRHHQGRHDARAEPGAAARGLRPYRPPR